MCFLIANTCKSIIVNNFFRPILFPFTIQEQAKSANRARRSERFDLMAMHKHQLRWTDKLAYVFFGEGGGGVAVTYMGYLFNL